jgi:uncharacterized protein (TIGR03083 family)
VSELTLHDYRHLLQVEAAALAEAGTDPDRLGLEIPHVEGWTVQSVIGHTAWTFRFSRLAIEAAPESPPSRASVPEPPPSDELLDWYRVSVEDLLKTLDDVDPNKLSPSFTGPQKARWWFRRMAHEVSIHRWDAQSAFTSPTPIDVAQARDGIDELLDVYGNRRMDFSVLDGQDDTIHLHATDIDDGEWMLRLGPESITWSHGHEKGDVAARGPVSDLLLLMWSRIPPARLEIFGQANLLERWQQAANF